MGDFDRPPIPLSYFLLPVVLCMKKNRRNIMKVFSRLLSQEFNLISANSFS